MKKIILLFLFLIITSPKPIYAQSSNQAQAFKQRFSKAQVVKVIEQGEKKINGVSYYYQTLKIQVLDGTEKGKYITIENGKEAQITRDQLVDKNQDIVLLKTNYPNGKNVYSIYDFYRLGTLFLFLIIFFFAVLFIAGMKGLGSIFGMLVSLGTIVLFIVPSILKGDDPLTVTLIGQ